MLRKSILPDILLKIIDKKMKQDRAFAIHLRIELFILVNQDITLLCL